MEKKLGTKQIHQPVNLNFQELECVTTESGRRYKTPEGNWYPSITTILSITKKESIKKWRKRIGAAEANKQTTKAASRGTSLHKLAEHYLRDGKLPDLKEGEDVPGYYHFKAVQHIIDKITDILCMEKVVWSDFLKLAGRTDCIAYFDGILSVIDFKTSKKLKKKEWIDDYFIQGAFYAKAIQERTNGIIYPQQVVIIMVADDKTPGMGSQQCEVYKEPVDNWIDDLISIRDMYEIQNIDRKR